MNQQSCKDFQETVAKYTMRHKSVLDIITKAQESNARLNRAIIKSVTNCGCIKILAEKKQLPTNVTFSDLALYLDNHLDGNLCGECREVIIEEMGKLLFYITALCNTFNIDLGEVFEKEQSKVLTLGKYNLT